MIDSEKIIAEEYTWVFNNEPTFTLEGNKLTGKVGRTPSGESILISIIVPQYYPIVKPEVKVTNSIIHPNIDGNNNLSLQLLDEWDPVYRLKDIISMTRRLFIKSKKSIDQTSYQDKSQTSELEIEIQSLQKEIGELNKKITEEKSKKLQASGSSELETMQVNEKDVLNAQNKALTDLLDLLVYKFEEAEVDQTDFFRLYRKYIKEKYLTERQMNKTKVIKNGISEEKTKEPIRH